MEHAQSPFTAERVAGGELGSEAPNQDLQLSEGERPAKSCLGDAPLGLWSVGACSAIYSQHLITVCSPPLAGALSFCPLPSTGWHHGLQTLELPLA